MTRPEEDPPSPSPDKAAASEAKQSVPVVKALQDVHGSTELIGDEKGSLTLAFDPTLAYVKVHLEFDEKLIKIDCDGDPGKECTFEFRFNKNDKREKTLEIRARAIEKESNETIDISCMDDADSALGATKRYWIKLKPGICILPTGYNVIAWVLYAWCIGRKYHLRYLFVAIVIIVFLFVSHTPPTDRIRSWINSAAIRRHLKDPDPFVGVWTDPFLPAADNRPDKTKWELPEPWILVDGTSDNRVDRAMSVQGDKAGTVILPTDLQALYDHTVVFNINISANQKCACWILRAKSPHDTSRLGVPSLKDYYLFKLSFPQNRSESAVLTGFAYKDGQRMGTLSLDIPDPLGYHPLSEGDTIWVTIEASEFRFKHSFNLDLANEDGNPNENFQGNPVDRVLTDFSELYRYGSFGFVAIDGCNMKVESVTINGTKVTSQPKANTTGQK